MLDRYLGFHFFTNDGGGNSMLYMNLIWVWGHPEVYILVLPAFGIYSEVAATFSGKPLFGYRSMVFATPQAQAPAAGPFTEAGAGGPGVQWARALVNAGGGALYMASSVAVRIRAMGMDPHLPTYLETVQLR